MEPRAYTITRSDADSGRAVTWAARTADRQTLGTLILTMPSHEIEWVGTLPKFRRKGIAAALFAQARADGFDPQHSQHRTPEGDAWARSVGGALPKNAMFAVVKRA